MPTDLVVFAVMVWGRWVGYCPRPGCGSAESFGRCDDGTVGGLTGDRFECRRDGYTPDGVRVVYGGCGLRCGVQWPANISDLERVLLARPALATRNWSPGETLDGLVAENLAHGLVPSDALNGGPSRPLLELRAGEVLAGALEFAPDPQLDER